MMLSSVDFPHPDGPVMTRNDRGATSNETSLSTTWASRLPTAGNILRFTEMRIESAAVHSVQRRHTLTRACSGCRIVNSMN